MKFNAVNRKVSAMVRGRLAGMVRAYLVKGVAGSLLGVFSSDFSLARLTSPSLFWLKLFRLISIRDMTPEWEG